MLTRQKILLALLDCATTPLSPTVLVKLAFLLRQETDVRQDATFYDFVPYRFGPFSFALYRELELLIHQSYVVQDEDGYLLDKSMAADTRRLISGLPPALRSSVRTVNASYAAKSQRSLVRDVYARYPWYATKSELKDLLPATMPPAATAPPAVYTAGYEGGSVDAFFARILRSGLRGIADVRANPVSRKYGFAKSSLSGIAAKLGLAYRHYPQLGIPSGERAALGSFASYQRLLDRYETEMLPRQKPAVADLAELIRAEPTALVCVESDVRCCHRSRLAEAVALASGLSVRHLA